MALKHFFTNFLCPRIIYEKPGGEIKDLIEMVSSQCEYLSFT